MRIISAATVQYSHTEGCPRSEVLMLSAHFPPQKFVAGLVAGLSRIGSLCRVTKIGHPI